MADSNLIHIILVRVLGEVALHEILLLNFQFLINLLN